MRRKHYLAVLFLLLAIFLAGCGAGIPTTPGISINEEANIKSVINEYFLAISYQNWSKAKSYCVYNSDRYYATVAMEQFVNSLALYGTVTISCLVNISNVSIYGNNAQAYVSLTLYMSYAGYFDTESGSTYYYLQKVGNAWKIYGPGVSA